MKVIYTSLLIGLIACSHLKTKKIVDDKSQAFQIGLELMKNKDYEESSLYWQNFLKKHPVGPLSPSAYYLLARSLEKRGNCAAAINHYKNAFTLWGAAPSKDKARVKLRLATCYIQVEKTDRAIAELSEMAIARNYYTWQDYNIERNVLFALAYSKEQNFKLAKKYYDLVDKYVSLALKSKKEMDESWLSDIFYQLAEGISVIKKDSIDEELIQPKQSYLLRVIEWNQEPYAKSAYKELEETYDNASNILMNASFIDLQELEKIQAYEKNRKKMESLVASLNRLLIEFNPAVKENAYIKKTKNWAEALIQSLQSKINEPLPSQDITEEAKKRQMIIPSTQQPKVLPQKMRIPKKDPNL